MERVGFIPPVSIASNATVSGQTYGNGMYMYKSSFSILPMTVPPAAMTNNITSFPSGSYIGLLTMRIVVSVYPAFDKNTTTYFSTSASYPTTSPYTYPYSTPTTTVSGTAQKGEWLQIRTPFELAVTSISISAYSSLANSASSWVVAGSQNSTTWFTLLDKTSTVIPLTTTTYDLPKQSVTYLRVIFRNGNGNNVIWINECSYTGTANFYPPLPMTSNSTTLTDGVYTIS